MSQENQSSLRFSLEESLWFRKGQEVEELVSISLDPDITIQENDQYVTIRGSLELTGEYKCLNEMPLSEEEENPSAQKYVQTIEEREEGICEFSHQFPVDITIPNNRIQSIYDIDVVVESFDYTLPERSCLKLSSELMISGLYGSQQIEPEEMAVEQEREEIDEEEQNIEILYRANDAQSDEEADKEEQYDDYSHLFTAEARKQPEEEGAVETNSYPNFSYQVPNNAYNQHENSYQELNNEYNQHEGAYQAPNAYNQNESTYYDDRNIGNNHVEITVEKETYTTEQHVEEKYVSPEESSSSSSSNHSLYKKKLKNKIVEKLTKKKSMSLTEFFARKVEGGEDQVKLKICIVQKGDTLSKLAERYDVSIQKLLTVNNLEMNQDVYVGQVLYIPETIVKSR